MKYVGIVLALIFSMMAYEIGSTPGMLDQFLNEVAAEILTYALLIVIVTGLTHLIINRIRS